MVVVIEKDLPGGAPSRKTHWVVLRRRELQEGCPWGRLAKAMQQLKEHHRLLKGEGRAGREGGFVDASPQGSVVEGHQPLPLSVVTGGLRGAYQ